MIETERLILRPWKKSDFRLFAEMNGDPEVMEFFPSLLSLEQSDRLASRLQSQIEEKGWGFFAAEEKKSGEFIGFIGLAEVDFEAAFTPAIEIGWRLRRPFWGRGLATEGAKAALEWGFSDLNIDEIVSFTAIQNTRSQAVMQRLQMTYSPADEFDHPKLPAGHPLRRHVLYRARKPH